MKSFILGGIRRRIEDYIQRRKIEEEEIERRKKIEIEEERNEKIYE